MSSEICYKQDVAGRGKVTFRRVSDEVVASRQRLYRDADTTPRVATLLDVVVIDDDQQLGLREGGLGLPVSAVPETKPDVTQDRVLSRIFAVTIFAFPELLETLTEVPTKASPEPTFKSNRQQVRKILSGVRNRPIEAAQNIDWDDDQLALPFQGMRRPRHKSYSVFDSTDLD